MNRIKKQKCFYHDNNRDLSEYIFWHTNIRKENHVDIWECKKCRERLERDLDRCNRIREHNKRKNEEYFARYTLKSKKWLEKKKKSQKEDIWDEEIRDELCRGMKIKGHMKYLYKESIPKEILRLKRASMKLERLINEIKKGRKYQKQIEEEKNKKILVNCPIHGSLFLFDVIKKGKSKWTGNQLYRCRKCMSDIHHKYYEKNRDNLLKKHAEYRQTKAKSWGKCNGNNTEHETTA